MIQFFIVRYLKINIICRKVFVRYSCENISTAPEKNSTVPEKLNLLKYVSRYRITPSSVFLFLYLFGFQKQNCEGEGVPTCDPLENF